MKGLFITFEGIDGCGKSLMLKQLAKKLTEQGTPLLTTREPGGSELGGRLRHILLDSPAGAVDERGEALLYAADRAIHVDKIIRPALAEGKVVLCDRYVDSSLAYQGKGRSIPADELRRINEFACYGLWPDLTLLLDLPVEVAFSRLRGPKDRLEQEDKAFFERTAQAFRELAAAEPQRFCVIDATQSIAQVRAQVWRAVESLLRAR